MSDSSVRAALRSNERLVVVEAPAGCGKTHQGAEYASEVAGADRGRMLILTHTHAACSVFADKTRGAGSRVEIRTIDSLVAQIACAYHDGLGVPKDTVAWVRQTKDGHAHLAVKVATLLERHPMIAAALADRYPVVVCDEHQDCSGDQHSIVMALHARGARLRVFGDPMQRIFKAKRLDGPRSPPDWTTLSKQGGPSEELDTPHRWKDGCPELGAWTLRARQALKAGGRLDLTANLPRSVQVVIAESQAQRHGDYRLSPGDRRSIDTFVGAHSSLLILSAFAATAQSLRAFFHRRIRLWEGHTRPALDRLVNAMLMHRGDAQQLANALLAFMGDVGTGFTASSFGKLLERELEEGCSRSASGKPAAVQAMARRILDAPDHTGVASALRMLAEFRKNQPAFAQVQLDCNAEFWEAVRLGDYGDLQEGIAHITQHRTHSRPKPPPQAISTIHKAKGLECDAVVVMPCDRKTFPDTPEARCLLYVALSRAKRNLQLVVSRDDPSPLLLV